MTWNSSLIGAERVNIELWGYREYNSGMEAQMNGSCCLQAELSYLYSLGRNLPNTGSFSFIPEPSMDYSDWELGNIRITTSSKSDGARYLLYIFFCPYLTDASKNCNFTVMLAGVVNLKKITVNGEKNIKNDMQCFQMLNLFR